MIEKIIKECKEEQIQFPSKIQNFGYLIAVDQESLEIKYVSENITDLTDYTSDAHLILDQNYHSIFTFEIDFPKLALFEPGQIHRETIQWKGKQYFGVFYRFNNYYYIELEEDKNINFVSTFYFHSEHILYARNKKENWEILLKKIKELTGYNRVLIYKLLEDKSGHVIYEEKDEGFESYLGLHFPEFDIPEQARDLYLKKRNRIISDIHQTPINILSSTTEQLDLTYSEFRAISPVHLQYLGNFGVQSSFSISIVINNKLWGIVSCHNKTPKHIPLNIRKQCEALLRMARINYVNFKFDEQLKYQEKFQKVMVKLKEELLIQDSTSYTIDSYIPLLKFTKANGVAYVKNGNVTSHAIVPDNDEILRIRNWAKQQHIQNLYYSNNFYNEYKDELQLSGKSAGVAFRFLDSDYENFIIWFKSEIAKELNWAGKPEKILETKVEDGKEVHTFAPRSNFQVWKGQIIGKSEIWKEKEINAIREIINLIVETIHVKAFKIRDLYEQLKEINAELDTFSYTISHDLRTPLTVMKLNCQMIERSLKEDETKGKKMKEVIDQIDSLSDMMQEILELSKAKNSDLKLQTIEANTLIQRIIHESKVYYNAENTIVNVTSVKDFICDKTMAYEIFLNVINNAIKYSSQQENPQVDIWASSDDDFVTYHIKDNGIGIKPEDRDKMFKLFSRMSNTSQFRGNGVGLSIVYRLMQRLGGSIDFVSEENKGTEFIIKFKKEL